MAHDLHTEERRLLSTLTELESAHHHYQIKIDEVTADIDAHKQDLNGIRDELLDEFLTEHLSPLMISYVIKTDLTNQIVLDLSPIVGGELEYDKMQVAMGWPDMDNVPLFYVFSYLGKGVPWSTNETAFYEVE